MERLADQSGRPGRTGWAIAAAGLLLLLSLPFGLRAISTGLSALGPVPAGKPYLWDPAEPLANTGLYLHMVTGAVLMFGATLQVTGPIRRRWPGFHRWVGRAVVLSALLTGAGGLVYIALRGTIGGAHMDAAFAVYGGLVLLCAVQAWRNARARRFDRHRVWALRLFVLALASWAYRVHYTLWYIVTGGLWSRPDFSGGFDQVQLWAFFLPYLALVELWLRLRPRVRAPAAPGGAADGRRAGPE